MRNKLILGLNFYKAAELYKVPFKRPIVSYVGSAYSLNYGDTLLYFSIKKLLRNIPIKPILNRIHDKSMLMDFILCGLRSSDYLILGGGTLINSPFYTKILVDNINNTPFIVFGTSVCDISNEGNCIDLIAPIIKTAYPIGVRTLYDQSIMNYYGIDAEFIGDPVFSFVDIKTYDNQTYKSKLVVGINLGNDSFNLNGPQDNIVRSMIHFIRYLKGNTNKEYVIVPIAMHPDDIIWLRKLVNDCNVNHKIIWSYGTSMNVVQAIRKCDFIIGQRLHFSIIAAACNIPFISIGYRNKIFQFCESINKSDWCLSMFATGYDIIDSFEERLINYASDVNYLSAVSSHFRQKQQDFAEKVLKKMAFE